MRKFCERCGRSHVMDLKDATMCSACAYASSHVTALDMLITILHNKGYDGLVGEDCYCALDDLMPCAFDSASGMDCEPGHFVPCPGGCGGGSDCTGQHMIVGPRGRRRAKR